MKISVITVCYNSERTIARCLNSIKKQSYNNVEVIIIDGKSTDKTLIIANDIYYDDATILSEEDYGIYNAMNKGIKLATGDVIHFLNSDDYFSDEFVLEKVATNFSDTGCDISYGSIKYVNHLNEVIDRWVPSKFIKGSFRTGWHCPHPGFFARTSLFSELGSFDCDLTIAADFDLMKRFMEHSVTRSHKLPFDIVNMENTGVSSSLIGIITGYTDIKKSFLKHNQNVGAFFFIKRYFLKLRRKLTNKLVTI